MSAFAWIDESMDFPLLAPQQALVWILRMDGPAANEALGSVRPTREDLADAAKAREAAGTGRLMRRLLLRACVARLLRRHVDDVSVQRAERGGLLLPDHGLCASVSGSGDYAAIAVGRHSVGVDIEAASASQDMRRWTAVEAFVKALGTGFGEAFGGYHLSQTQTGFALRDGQGRGGKGEWRVTPAFTAAAIQSPALL